jgi:methionyl-tRNA synthetase
VLTHKYFDGKVPPVGPQYDLEAEVEEQLRALPAKISEALDNFKFRDALAAMMEVARLGNKYLAETEPWKLIKDESQQARVGTILNLSLQLAANLSILAEPFLPHTAAKLRRMLTLEQPLSWAEAGHLNLLASGQALAPAELLFTKIEDSTVEEQVNKLEATKAANEQANAAPAPLKDTIQYDDFAKLDMRIGTVLSAEKVKKSKKLLKLLVDTGVDQRTILSGIAQHFEPEELVGQQVMVLANLAPRAMMGTESQGMVLMAEDADGRLRLVRPTEKVKNGSGVS